MSRFPRTLVATQMDLRDLRRRPLILLLLVITPVVFISRAIANTQPIKRTIGLADGSTATTTMRDIHGADMTLIAVAFLAGLVGVFIMNAARQADGRLVRAGFGALETVVARLNVLVLCTVIVVGVSLAVTAKDFAPQQWGWFAAGTLVVGLTFAGLGAMASALFGRIGATYVLLFLAMLDLGIVQNPMFGNGTPPTWAMALPGFPGTRTVMNAALSPGSGMPLLPVAGMVAWLLAVMAVTIWRLTAGLRAVG